jgi:hypothetical protein
MTSLLRHSVLSARSAALVVSCSKVLRNIACQTLSPGSREYTDACVVPMDVCGTKIALTVGSLDLDMPPGPFAHQGREKPDRHGSGTLQGHSVGGRAWAGGVWQGNMTSHYTA